MKRVSTDDPDGLCDVTKRLKIDEIPKVEEEAVWEQAFGLT